MFGVYFWFVVLGLVGCFDLGLRLLLYFTFWGCVCLFGSGCVLFVVVYCSCFV